MRDLSLHLLDIIQNSLAAHSSKITVSVNANIHTGLLELRIEDNGVGMEPDLLKRVTDPFATTRDTRRVGLGLPLLKDSAERVQGWVEIQSRKNEGTTVQAFFQISHIDRLPLGDLGDTIVGCILSNPKVQLLLDLYCADKQFRFDVEEVRAKLQGVSILQPKVLDWIREYVNEGVIHIFGGVLNEING